MRTPTGWTRSAVLAASVAVAGALVVAPAIARAQQAGATDQARQHFTRGKELFASGEYRGAIAEFAAADKLAPSPLLEFNIALCHERLGERAEAVRRFKLYLERVPDAENRSAVEAKIGKLEAELKSEAQSKAAPAPPPLVPPPVGDQAAPAPDGAPPVGPPPSTGDKDLDRAAAIDIGQLRAKRRDTGNQPPPSSRAAGPPPSAPPSGQGEPAPRPPRDEGEKKSTPVYKKWWFWVAAAVGAVILVSLVTADSDDGDGGRARMLPFGDAGRDVAQPGGAVLLRF
jgi:hypothetical protein